MMGAANRGQQSAVANVRCRRAPRTAELVSRLGVEDSGWRIATRICHALAIAVLGAMAGDVARPEAANGGEPTTVEPLTRLGFGSCAKQDKPQPIWNAVVAGKPQLFMMIGDNIYGDTEDMDLLRRKYELLGAQPGFLALRQACPVLATWDDHDLGANDAGADYPKQIGRAHV